MRRLVLAALLVATGCSAAPGTGAPRTAAPTRSPSPPLTSSADAVPQAPVSASATSSAAPSAPAHVVVVMEENKGADQVLSGTGAPYIQSLGRAGAVLTGYDAITHPSEPNYLALFSGSTQGVASDACPLSFAGANLGSSLRASGRSFAGYSESLPAAGSTVCSSGSGYARKHSPWVDFTDLPASVNQPFSAFPSDYSALPTVAFVIPNLQHDMHDGTIAEGDAWLRRNLGGYANWAGTHDSLLLVLFDESDAGADNRVAAVVYGAGVRPGRYPARVNHYSTLRWIEDLFGLPRLANSASAPPFPDIRP